MPKEKECVRCGKTFTAKYKNIYCSDYCKKERCKCDGCGVEFTKKDSTTGKFCSLDCWYKAPGKKIYDTRRCVVCDIEFQPGSRDQKSCSVKCSHKSLRSKNRVSNCIRCNNPLKPKCHPRVRYCSRACALQVVRGKTTHYKAGETKMDSTGYLRVKVEGHPNSYKGGWIMQHRYLMEQNLGRYLESHERVHHKNGNRADNRLENLELWKQKDPPGVRASDYHCAGCRCHVLHI